MLFTHLKYKAIPALMRISLATQCPIEYSVGISNKHIFTSEKNLHTKNQTINLQKIAVILLIKVFTNSLQQIY